MPDIRLVEKAQPFPQPPSEAVIDWAVNAAGTVDESQALATAIMVALGTDRLADVDDELPDNLSNDRKGWWGDLDAAAIWNGWPIGTRLWTMKRDSITGPGYRRGATTAKVDSFIREALQPFVDRRIISSFTISVAQVNDQRIDAKIMMMRSLAPAVTMEFQFLWDELKKA